MSGRAGSSRASLGAVAREWGRIGCLGFGGPPAHIALLRRLCVVERRWVSAERFENGIAAVNLLPGPASTQLAILCGAYVRGRAGALVAGACFIAPGLVVILGLAALFLGSPPLWVRGAGAGAGAAVAAVAVHAGASLAPGSWRRAASRARWTAYALAGGLAAAAVGAWLVAVLVACGTIETLWRRGGPAALSGWPAGPLAALAGQGGAASLAWVALKVGALSFGGGFVIVPLMRADAVHAHHWMSDPQFLNAVALGQVTPGPVVLTVAVVGYAAAGLAGGLLAALVAFAPSFLVVLLGAERLDRLSASPSTRAFLGGAGPAAVGAIIGSAAPLALALREGWQAAVLAAAGVALLALRRGVVAVLVVAGLVGVGAVTAGAAVPR